MLQSPLFKVSLKYGLIGSILAMVVIMVLFFTGSHPMLIFPLFDFRIFLFGVFIFFGIKEFKDYFNDGYLQFWQGLLIGFIVYITIGILASLFVVIFSETTPEFLQGYIEGNVKGLMDKKDQLVNDTNISITEEEFNRQIRLLKESKSYAIGVDYFIKSCVMGFFVMLLMAVILRKSESRFTNQGN